MRVWNVEDGSLSSPVMRHAGLVNRVSFSADGRRVVSASDDGSVRVWRPRPPPVVDRTLPVKCTSPDGRWLVVRNSPGRLGLLDSSTLEDSPVAFQVDAETYLAKVSRDGKSLFTACFSDGRPDTTQLQTWDMQTGRLLLRGEIKAISVGAPVLLAVDDSLEHVLVAVERLLANAGRLKEPGGCGTSRRGGASRACHSTRP